MLQSVTPARTCPALEACLEPENSVVRGRPVRHERCGALRGLLREPRGHGAHEAEREKNRAMGAEGAKRPAALENAVVRAIIGDRELHKSQRVVLSSLRAGNSCCRHGDGGAAQVAHLPGACCMRRSRTIRRACSSIRCVRLSLTRRFTSTKRSLLWNQRVHAHGERHARAPSSLFGLRDGSVDIVLTTPEFLVCHAPEFAAVGRIGFVVVDEAHHIGLSRAGIAPHMRSSEALSRR